MREQRNWVMGPVLAAVVTALLAGWSVASGAGAAGAELDSEWRIDSELSSDALPTVQIDGVVWSQTAIGNTVYVTGNFSSARPAGSPSGTNESQAANILAFDIRTGKRISSFNASLNAQGRAIQASPDGSRIYVGGDFTTANGERHERLAALDATTGAVISSFAPTVSNTVNAIAVTDEAVYIGGAFFNASGFTRTRLAAFTPSGQLRTWKPVADDHNVLALAASPDQTRIVVGGQFSSLNGVAAGGLGALDAQTAQTLPFAANLAIDNSGDDAGIASLRTDGKLIFGAGYAFGFVGNLEGAFAAEPHTGEIVWIEDCHGDTYDTYAIGRSVLTATHAHYCNNIDSYPQNTFGEWTWARAMSFTYEPTQVIKEEQGKYFNWAGTPAPNAQDFWPSLTAGTFTGQDQAAWSITGNADYVSFGGEFPTVNSVNQQGLVRFATTARAPNKMGPIWEESLRPVLTSVGTGEVRIQWRSTWDRDDSLLRYRVIRDERTSAPIFETTTRSNSWSRPGMGYTDTGLKPGATHKYRVHVLDGDGNVAPSYAATITLPDRGEPARTEYARVVAADGASNYWRLGEDAGEFAADYAGGSWLTMAPGIRPAASGAIAEEVKGGSSFTGASGEVGYPQDRIEAPRSFSVEAWIRTTSDAGGRIVGFSDRQSGSGSAAYRDRQLYLGTDGRAYFGINPQTGRRTLGSDVPVNDGEWHHVVGTMSTGRGMALYVDGLRVAQDRSATDYRFYSGYWRLGADSLSGWPKAGSQQAIRGTLDDVAIYPKALTRARVNAHWIAAGRSGALPGVPTDEYGRAIHDLDPDLYWRLDDASGGVAVDSGSALNSGVVGGSVEWGAPGVLFEGAGTSATFDGSGSAIVASDPVPGGPRAFSAGVWFRTSTASGGKLIGFGDAASGLSTRFDRHIFMQDDGRLAFGTYTTQKNMIITPGAYNDGEWHMAVAIQGRQGMALYVDGAAVGFHKESGAEQGDGYWRIGGGKTWGSSSKYFEGQLDEAVVIDRALAGEEVAHLYGLGWGPRATAPPPATGKTARVSVAKAGYGNKLFVNVNPNKGSRYWTFKVQERGGGGAWKNRSSYRTKGSKETRTITLGEGTFRVVVRSKFGYGSGTSSAVALTEKTVKAKVSRTKSRSKLRVNVNPNKGKRYWKFRVQKQRASGSWKTRSQVYRTRGKSETRTVNLRRGTYRVLVKGKFGYLGTTSSEVTLKR